MKAGEGPLSEFQVPEGKCPVSSPPENQISLLHLLFSLGEPHGHINHILLIDQKPPDGIPLNRLSVREHEDMF